MSFDNRDRAKVRRLRRIMNEATIGPMFTRPMLRPKSISINDPQLEELLASRKFLRRKFRVVGCEPQKTKKAEYENRRGLLCTTPACSRPGLSNYLSILKQKWQSQDAVESAKLELTVIRPASAACNVSRREESQFAVSLAIPMDLSRTSASRTRTNLTPARKAIDKVLENEAMMCNCATLNCVCGRRSISSLAKDQNDAALTSLEDIMGQCRELRRNTLILRKKSVRYLASAISEQKTATKKLLSKIKPKAPQ